jgi:cytochrome c556
MWRGFTVLSGALIGLGAVGLLPQEKANVPGTDVIAARQASLDMSAITFHSMGDAMKAGREAKTQAYSAAVLEKWAKALPKMFPAGTGDGETTTESQAMSAIWQDHAGFDREAAHYADATAKLSALAAANDTVSFTKQLEEVNASCNSCHSRYKSGAQGSPRK